MNVDARDLRSTAGFDCTCSRLFPPLNVLGVTLVLSRCFHPVLAWSPPFRRPGESRREHLGHPGGGGLGRSTGPGAPMISDVRTYRFWDIRLTDLAVNSHRPCMTSWHLWVRWFSSDQAVVFKVHVGLPGCISSNSNPVKCSHQANA